MNKLLILTQDADEYARELATHELPDLQIVTATSPAEGRDSVRDADIILGRPAFVAEVLDQAKALVWVQSTYAGVEPFLRPGQRRDYVLTGVKGIFGPLMSEYVFAYILGLERDLWQMRENQRRGLWADVPYRSLAGLTIGIAGLGSIGQHIARTAAHFGMRVVGLKRSAGAVSHVDRVYVPAELAEFVTDLDYLVITLPNTPATHRLIDASTLDHMKPSAALINIGRGAVVAQDDLVPALREGRLRAAVLDVFEEEPLPAESPLWGLERAYITPHNSAKSFPRDVARIFADNYRRFRADEPLQYIVDFERGY